MSGCWSSRALVVAFTVALVAAGVPAHAQRDSLDKTPSWYMGSKPWSSISREGRLEILRMRRGAEAYKAKAETRSTRGPATGAAAGKALLNRIVSSNHLDDYYRTPDTFGERMVIWLPERAWKALTESERSQLKAYLSSQYTNWGIGVGRIHGRDVYSDRLVVEH